MVPATASEPLPETKRVLLDAALKLMLAKGYTATSVDEICCAAKLTKGSFFHYFESKDDLALALAEYFFSRQCEMFGNAPFRQLKDPLERVFGRLNFMAALARDPRMPRSCLVGNFAQELSATHPEIRKFCAGVFEKGTADFAKDLAEAQKSHPSATKFDPESVARLLFTIVQGSMILGKAAQNTVVLSENVEHLRLYIEQLFGRTARG